MNQVNYKTLILMPYLPLKGTLKIENLILWSYKNEVNKHILDPDLKAHLASLVSCYKYPSGRSIENPTIISIDQHDFHNPTDEDYNFIEKVKNILLFSCLIKNYEYSFVTSDNFEVFYQRFNVGDPGIATTGGAIHRITTGGYKINELSFIKPDHVNMPFDLRLSGNTLNALIDCIKNQTTDINKSQIIQSLNPLYNAYRNSHELNLAGRTLFLIMAFELLFGQSSRSYFRNSIQTYSTMGIRNALPQYTYPEMDTRTGNKIKDLTLTQNQIWAEEFYKLRHRIIHGDTVTISDFEFTDLINLTKQHDPHFFIAVNFFVVCLLNKLRQLGFASVPHYVVDPTSSSGFGAKFSGIENEVFKIEDVSIFDDIENALKKK